MTPAWNSQTRRAPTKRSRTSARCWRPGFPEMIRRKNGAMRGTGSRRHVYFAAGECLRVRQQGRQRSLSGRVVRGRVGGIIAKGGYAIAACNRWAVGRTAFLRRTAALAIVGVSSFSPPLGNRRARPSLRAMQCWCWLLAAAAIKVERRLHAAAVLRAQAPQ